MLVAQGVPRSTDTNDGATGRDSSIHDRLVKASHSSIRRISISPFTVTGAHAHWVGSTDTPSHAAKELKMR